jgi:hypothetical protein
LRKTVLAVVALLAAPATALGHIKKEPMRAGDGPTA